MNNKEKLIKQALKLKPTKIIVGDSDWRYDFFILGFGMWKHDDSQNI